MIPVLGKNMQIIMTPHVNKNRVGPYIEYPIRGTGIVD
jgi:hypothetical protein